MNLFQKILQQLKIHLSKKISIYIKNKHAVIYAYTNVLKCNKLMYNLKKFSFSRFLNTNPCVKTAYNINVKSSIKCCLEMCLFSEQLNSICSYKSIIRKYKSINNRIIFIFS